MAGGNSGRVWFGPARTVPRNGADAELGISVCELDEPNGGRVAGCGSTVKSLTMQPKLELQACPNCLVQHYGRHTDSCGVLVMSAIPFKVWLQPGAQHSAISRLKGKACEHQTLSAPRDSGAGLQMYKHAGGACLTFPSSYKNDWGVPEVTSTRA